VLLALATPALAHHGNAAYDDKITEFKTPRHKVAGPTRTRGRFRRQGRERNRCTWSETAAPQALRLIGGTDLSGAGRRGDRRCTSQRTATLPGGSNKIILKDGSELHDTQLGGDAGGKSRYDPDAK